ncbi:trypsin-like peptidase domain-containing protein [Streptomyces sp. NPDC031705]|uniref:S1C family serine protease n=1 Tax=Streptomyces sp. NPDC031705 TaxID=3155729 RepID=UPI003400A2C6
MTDSFRRDGGHPQQNQENGPDRHGAPFGDDWQRGRERLARDAGAGGYPPPPPYPPGSADGRAPGWYEAHQPPVAPAAAPAGPAHAARARRPVGLITAVALAAALVGGGTAVGVQQFLGQGGAAGGGFSGTNVSQSGSGTVAGVSEQVSPSVVRIDTRTGSAQGGTGTGSGFVLTADGEIATNNHVVAGASEIGVTTSDGKKYEAKIVGTDPDKDLALIKLQGASGLKPARLGDSDRLKVGDEVVAIGSPDRLTGTVTSGIVSALNREVNVPKSEDRRQSPQRQGGGWPFSYGGQQFNGTTGSDTTSYKAIQTDASLNPGNSGGALVNMNGEIVGMPSAIYSPAGDSSGAGSVGLGFAIPVNTVKADLDSLRRGGAGQGGGDSGATGFGTSF